MAVVVLTFTGSDEEIVSGIPKTIDITSNVPATIYFTIDGTTPTTNSTIYIDTFEFPTGFTSIILSAFGIDGMDEVGPILTQVFAADTTDITITRHVGNEGIVIDRAGEGLDIVDGFDADGNPNRFLDIEEVDLDIVREQQGYLGLEPGTVVQVNIPSPTSTPYPFDDQFVPFSTPEIAELFNPYAKTIVIDNRIENDLNMVLRPFGSLTNVQREAGGRKVRAPSATYVSGGFVRKFYDARNNVMVSYYFDHNEGRHIKNIQNLPSNIPHTFGNGSLGPPLIFRWITPGMQTGLLF